MVAASLQGSSASRPRPRRPANTAVIGMALFVFTEVMLFAGFVSAFVIVQSHTPPGAWPPPNQPRLPVARTALNTMALLASGVALHVAGRKLRRFESRTASLWMGAALALGAFFVVGQGMEWVALLRQGLTLTSSQLGSFFYLIVGLHGLHAVVAIAALGLAWRALLRGRLTDGWLGAVQLFWYFVVLIWPVLYWKVYL